MTIKIPIKKEAMSLSNISDESLIRRFRIKNKGKYRDVNDPIPELKQILKGWNSPITDYYIGLLIKNGLNDVAHAYLPNKSIMSNANRHKHSSIIQFDFKGFYDSCKYEYFKQVFYDMDSSFTKDDDYMVKRLVIDPKTGGVTQGLPVSGALAGITLIPFWNELLKLLPQNIRFTQYSDDLTFSYVGKIPKVFTIKELTTIIYAALNNCGLDFKLNESKTRIQHSQYRKVTGVRINYHNQTTPSREDYRFLRHALYVLSKSNNLQNELGVWGFKSKASFVGKVSYMRSIDETNKINKLIMKYSDTCRKHGIFTTWLKQVENLNPFM